MMLKRSMVARFVVAVLATLTAIALRALLKPWFGASSPFLFFTPAVMLSAWYGGLGPGLLTTAAGAVLIDVFFLDPRGTLSLDSDQLSRMALFIIVGVQISWLSGAMYTARRRAEADAQAASRSERLYRMLASNFPDGFVCLFDDRLHWTLVAGAGLPAAGLARERMEGLPITASLPPETADPVKRLCAGAMDSRAARAEINLHRRIYFVQALPLKTEDESEHVGMIIFEDVTERVQAREQLQKAYESLEQRVRDRTEELRFQRMLLESQIQASADGIVAIDRAGRVIFANDRFHEMWRLTTPRIEGASQRSLMRQMRDQQLDPREPDPFSQEHPGIPVNEPQLSDPILLNDGRTLERYSAPILDADGSSFGQVWFFRDATERRRMQREILEAAERERQRFGQDLHDDLCQQLSGIACLSRALEQHLSRHDAGNNAAAQAAEITTMLQQANERARDLARGLQPVDLRKLGLVPALEQLCSSITNVFRVPCSLNADGSEVEMDEAISIQLYRICQEAISNAIRHANPTRIELECRASDDRVTLLIADDGKGIPQPLPQSGLGLYTMNYRAQLIGGSLAIERRTPCGTTVTCSVPLRATPISAAHNVSATAAT